MATYFSGSNGFFRIILIFPDCDTGILGGEKMARNSSSSNNRAQQLAAQQAAQRAQEEAARKAAIQAQIDARNGQIGQLSGIIPELQSERTDMTNSIQKWMNAKEVFWQENITYAGEVKNIFEGQAAKSVKQQNDSKISLMDGKMTNATAIKDSISVQENSVRTRISILSTEIRNLRSRL